MTETRWVRIAPVSQIPLREGRAVRIGSRGIALVNLGHRVRATAHQCPHRGGRLRVVEVAA